MYALFLIPAPLASRLVSDGPLAVRSTPERKSLTGHRLLAQS